MLHEPVEGPLLAASSGCPDWLATKPACLSQNLDANHDPGLESGLIEICLEWSTIAAWRRLAEVQQ
jgi:hypothetical protein